ncbi:AtpZ/AtpI family protein [Anoxybacterium hadale]|uniref:AtpZ/AtpI family protein n=1 Tax=Anoxybacterium hadale TaxID=3408580 RepID=A0ACD1AEZ8_9FIRM|nr:AtpZ/AtpI family protein [Clostridiales bacterium]
MKSKEQSKKENSDERPEKTSPQAGLEALVLFSQLGLTMAIPILLGAIGGHWLDEKFGTKVVFLILLVCLGIVGGIAGAYRQITAVTKKKSK